VDAVTIGVIVTIMFLVSLALGMHVGLALLTAGFVGITMLRGYDRALSMLSTSAVGYVSNYSLAVIPMFMLMGNFAIGSGITKDLFDACYKWFGSRKGGLGVITIATTAIFNCFCGSATASTATMGTVCYPEMTRYGYRPHVGAALIASCSAYGLLIPPSLGFIIYAMMAEVSVARVFAAGVIPGIIVFVLSFGLLAVWARIDPKAMPAGEKFSLQERLRSLKGVIAFAALFLFMLWGIFTGFFSPSEGGAIGAAGAFLMMVARRKASFKNVWSALRDSAKTTVMIFTIMLGATYFGTFMAMTQLPRRLASLLIASDLSPFAILWIIVLVYVLLGMVLDNLPLLTILTPIFMPIVYAMGWDPIWFGVISILCMIIGLITPPDGVPVYVISGITGVPLFTVFKGCVPFFILVSGVLVLCVYIEPLSTWLPRVMMG